MLALYLTLAQPNGKLASKLEKRHAPAQIVAGKIGRQQRFAQSRPHHRQNDSPLEVDALMKRVPKGKLITITEIRTALAKRHGVNVCCPITTGIFAWIAAHAAEEAVTDAAANGRGRPKITPYWRTLKTGGELNPKYPGGIARLRKQLIAEGHRLVAKGKRFFVADYEKSLEVL